MPKTLKITTPNPLTIDTSNPNIDLTLDSDGFARDTLTSLGFSSVSGLSSTWDTVANQLAVSFDSAQNETVSVREYLTPIAIDLFIGLIVETALNNAGYRNIWGLTASWNSTLNSFHVTYSGAYNSEGYYISNSDATIVVNNKGNVVSYLGSGYSPAGAFSINKNDLTSNEKSIIKTAFQEIKSLENIIDSIAGLNTKEAITEIAFEAAGITQVQGLTVEWDSVDNTSTATMNSARQSGITVTDVTLVMSTNSNHSYIDYYWRESTVYGSKTYGYQYDLTGTEEYIITEANKAVDIIESAVANHSFTNGNLTFNFDVQGSVSDYAAAITHSDVGVISTTENSLTALDISNISQSYSELSSLERTVTSIQSALTSTAVMNTVLGTIGYSDFSGLTTLWNATSKTISVSFDSANLNDALITNGTIVGVVNDNGNLTSYNLTASSDAGQINSSLANLTDTESYLPKVSLKTISDPEAYKEAQANTSPLNNVTLDLWRDDADTGEDLAISNGEIGINQAHTFDEIKLSTTEAYSPDIKIGDAIDILRHIVAIKTLDPTSSQFHAADVDNDGAVKIGDAIDVLRHIVDIKKIDTFDLIDDQGARVTQLDPDVTGDAPTWTLVANGDVNASGSFAEDYVVSIDVV